MKGAIVYLETIRIGSATCDSNVWSWVAPYVRIVVASIESPPGAAIKDGNGKVLREVQR
jgi:hypothetical protein